MVTHGWMAGCCVVVFGSSVGNTEAALGGVNMADSMVTAAEHVVRVQAFVQRRRKFGALWSQTVKHQLGHIEGKRDGRSASEFIKHLAAHVGVPYNEV